MGQKLLITESEKISIQKMYGLNKNYFLIESKEDLKDEIDVLYDENPKRFLENVIQKFPFLNKFKNDLLDKFNFIMGKGNKSVIIPLIVSTVLAVTSCGQNPNDQKCKPNKPKNDLELFRVEFEKKHPNYTVNNDLVLNKINDSLKDEFMSVMNNINWDSIPMMIDRIEVVNGKPIIHFGYGGIEMSKSSQTFNLVNIEFFGEVTEEEAFNLAEEKYYKFDFEIIKKIDVSNYQNYTNRSSFVFFNDGIEVEVSDSIVTDDKLIPPYFKPEGDVFTYQPMEITLGAWLVKINKIY